MSAKRPRPPRRVWLGIALVALVAAGGSVLALTMRGAPKPLERYGQVPDFSLLSQDDQPFTRADLLGEVTIANFIFTRCPTVCPVFTLKMRRLQDRTEDLGAALQLVSFSVDPEYDRPAVLREYAAKNGATERWHFLTGEADVVKSTVEGGLKISMARRGTLEDGAPDIVHGSHFVLIDAGGEIRGYYNSDDKDRIEALISDARQLVSER
jgi:protein SCO1/2